MEDLFAVLAFALIGDARQVLRRLYLAQPRLELEQQRAAAPNRAFPLQSAWLLNSRPPARSACCLRHRRPARSARRRGFGAAALPAFALDLALGARPRHLCRLHGLDRLLLEHEQLGAHGSGSE